MTYINLFLLFFITSVSYSQDRFEALKNPCILDEKVDVLKDQFCQNRIINKSKENLSMLWIRENISLPQFWETYVSDYTADYSTNINRSFWPLELYKDSSIQLDVHFQTDGVQGCAHVVLWVFEVNDTVKRLKIDYLFNKVLSNHQVKNIFIKMYPNPSTNTFTLESNSQITYVELMDIFGKNVASYSTHQNNTYDISHLNDGIYLVKILDSNKQYISTLRLQKQGPRS